MSNSVAISATNLGKMYRIGVQREKASSRIGRVGQAVTSPFHYLSTRLRKADDAEIIWALRDVSFELVQGEVLGVIGRNGAGKSTLLKILSRITDPSVGNAKITGRVNSLLEVGTGFHEELSGRENIYMSAAIHGMKKVEIDSKLDEIVDFSGVEKFLDTPVKRYSSGMRVRLGFAVAANLDPDVLVIDEVLAVGDYEFQKKCLGKMEDAASQGRTVIFVSHNMDAVERLCTQAILLNDGGLEKHGSVADIIRAYLGSSAKESAEKTWMDSAIAPGDHVVRLQRMRATNAAGEVCRVFKTTEPINLELLYRVQEPDHELVTCIYLYNESGELIFLTLDSQDPQWSEKSRSMGLHSSRCHIPANLLNDGHLSILVGVATHPWVVQALVRDVLSLKIVDDYEKPGARGSFSREWPGGAVRPLLVWSFDVEGESFA